MSGGELSAQVAHEPLGVLEARLELFYVAAAAAVSILDR